MSVTRPYIRPGFILSHIVNPIARHLRPVTTLTVRGRVSGELRTTPHGGPITYAGRRYLVSGRGDTHWARNLRAAGVGELRSHGRTERFRAIEVEGAERDQVLSAYRATLGRSVDAYFREIPDPAGHPTFRIEPLATGDEI